MNNTISTVRAMVHFAKSRNKTIKEFRVHKKVYKCLFNQLIPFMIEGSYKTSTLLGIPLIIDNRLNKRSISAKYE